MARTLQDYDEDFEDDEDDAQPAAKHHTPAPKRQVEKMLCFQWQLSPLSFDTHKHRL